MVTTAAQSTQSKVEATNGAMLHPPANANMRCLETELIKQLMKMTSPFCY